MVTFPEDVKKHPRAQKCLPYYCLRISGIFSGTRREDRHLIRCIRLKFAAGEKVSAIAREMKSTSQTVMRAGSKKIAQSFVGSKYAKSVLIRGQSNLPECLIEIIRERLE